MVLWIPLISFVAIVGLIRILLKAYPKILLKIPSPPSIPIIGHGLYFIGHNTEEQLKIAKNLCFEYPKLMKFWFFNIMAIFVNSPELIQKVWTSEACMQKPYIAYRLFALDNGLLVSRYHRWVHDRRFFNNSFKISTLQTFLPTFSDAANRIADDISNHVNGESFDIYPKILKCTLKMICSTSLGMKINDKENDETFEKIFKAANYVIESISTLQNKPLVYPTTFYLLTPRFWKHLQEALFLKNFHHRLIDERRKVLEMNVDENNNDEESKRNYNIFIDQVLKNKGLFSDADIREHIITILAAGYETTATTTSHCLLYLSMFQDIQQKVVDEINEIFPTDDTEINLESLAKLQYMERVIKETMRLAPVGPVIFRETMEDFEIEPGVIVPKGVIFILHIYSLHRQKHIWGENAEQFDPDNFLREKVIARHPASFIPFSIGRRNCIGNRYALMSMKIILMRLLKKYKFETSLKYDELRFKSTLTLKLIGEHSVRISKRD